MMRRYALAAVTSAAVHAAALAAVIGWPGGTTAPEPQVIAVTLVAPEPPKPVLLPQPVIEPPPAVTEMPPAAIEAPKPQPPKAAAPAAEKRPKPRAEPRPAPVPAPAEEVAALQPTATAPAATPEPAAPEAETQQAAVAPPPPPARPAGPTLPVRAAGNPRPAYPAIARERGLEGQVHLRVEVSASGAVRAVTVLRSSGYSSLDRAAQDAVQSWRFQPAMVDGEPRDGAIEFPVTFRLDGTG